MLWRNQGRRRDAHSCIDTLWPKRFLCPHHHGTHYPLLRIQVLHSVFPLGGSSGFNTAPQQITGKYVIYLEIKMSKTLKLLAENIKLNIFNGDSYCYIQNILGWNSINQAFILKFTPCHLLDMRRGTALCVSYQKGLETFVCQWGYG